MLYEMLTFKNPYLDPRSIHQTTLNVIEADPILPRKLVPWLPAEVEAICLKAMSKEPEDRYQSMEEFRDDIKRYQRGEQVLANPPSLRGRLRYFLKKHWAPLTIAGTILLFSALFGVFFFLQSQREQSRWQLIAEERFEDSTALGRWTVRSAPGGSDAAVWMVADHGLRVKARGFSYMTYAPSFSRNVKFEFDVRSLDAGFDDAGFFAYGSEPDSGYCFHLHHRGSALNGITCPHSNLLFYDYSPLAFAPDSQYHVVIEKADNAISFTVNDVCIGKLYDYFPQYGKDHQNMGFFVRNGGYEFSNVKIYRRAAPMLASPTIIADRFMAHGEFESALDEYRDLLLDFPEASFGREVELKMADCLLRLGRLDEAERLIDKQEWSKADQEGVRVYNLALKGLLFRKRGEALHAERCFILLASLFPAHHINQSILRDYLIDCERLLAEGRADSAQQRILALAPKYRRYSQLCGQLHLKVLDYYCRKPLPDSALATGERIERLYGRDDEIGIAARVQVSRILLGKGQHALAMDRLNQCLASHRPTLAVWQAWFTLAQKYESEGNFADALTTYKKVFQECPASLPLVWQARLKMGELAGLVAYEESGRTIFRQVAAARQPFSLPRLIAAWYSDSLSAEAFQAEWNRLNPGDPASSYYLGRKALLANDCFSAEMLLQDFQETLPAQSWEAVYNAKLASAVEAQCKKQ
jgi:tetratricopeptide (TPR) repeat protein